MTLGGEKREAKQKMDSTTENKLRVAGEEVGGEARGEEEADSLLRKEPDVQLDVGLDSRTPGS